MKSISQVGSIKTLKISGIVGLIILSLFFIKMANEYFKVNNKFIERILLQKDTDGDGLSDKYEKSLFNSEMSEILYNKEISDLPLIEVRVANQPYLVIDEEIIETTTNTSTNKTDVKKGVEVSKSYSLNVSSEWNVSGKISASLTDFGAEISGTYGEKRETGYGSGHTSVNEKGVSWENGKTKGTQYTLKQGKLVCPILVKNYGNLPAIIKNMTLLALITDDGGNNKYYGTLKFDGDVFPVLNLEGNSEEVLLNFVDAGLFSQEIDLLKEIQGKIKVKLISADLSSPLINSYIKQRSLVKNKSIRVYLIHERNHTDNKVLDVYAERNATLKDVIKTIGLNITYKNGWIYEINENRGDKDFDFSAWHVKHEGLRKTNKFSQIYSIDNPIKLEEIKVQKEDVVYFYKEEIKNKLHLSLDKIKSLYEYNFTEGHESVVSQVVDDAGQNLYLPENVIYFEKTDEDFNRKQLTPIRRFELSEIYYDAMDKIYSDHIKYLENDEETSPKEYEGAARRASYEKYPIEEWIREYCIKNSLVIAESSADYYLKTNKLYEHSYGKNIKVRIKFKKDENIKNYTFHFHSYVANPKLIKVNGEIVNASKVEKDKITISNPSIVEFYYEYAHNEKEKLIRHVEVFEFE